jgi:hypothetical protein
VTASGGAKGMLAGLGGKSGAPPPPGSALRGGGGAGGPGGASPSSGAGGVTGAFKTPASPPFPRAAYSQRTQSGPARMGEDAMVLPSPSSSSAGEIMVHFEHRNLQVPFVYHSVLSINGSATAATAATLPLTISISYVRKRSTTYMTFCS